METGQKLRYFFASVLLIAFFIFLFIGFGSINENIDSSCFIGYMVLAVGLLISSVILFATARFQPHKDRPVNTESQKTASEQ